VKRFFNEKEVTSTLVMDALYCGAKLLEEGGRRWLAQPQLAQQAQQAQQQQAEEQQAEQQQQQPSDQQAEQQQQQAEQQPAEGQQQTQQPPAAGSGQAVPTGGLKDTKRGMFFFAGDVIRCVMVGLSGSDGCCVVWPADQHLQHSCHWHALMRQTRSVCVSNLCRKPPPARHFGPQRAGAGSSRRHPSFPVG